MQRDGGRPRPVGDSKASHGCMPNTRTSITDKASNGTQRRRLKFNSGDLERFLCAIRRQWRLQPTGEVMWLASPWWQLIIRFTRGAGGLQAADVDALSSFIQLAAVIERAGEIYFSLGQLLRKTQHAGLSVRRAPPFSPHCQQVDSGPDFSLHRNTRARTSVVVCVCETVNSINSSDWEQQVGVNYNSAAFPCSQGDALSVCIQLSSRLFK